MIFRTRTSHKDVRLSVIYPMMCHLGQELSTRAVDGRLRRMCERKPRTNSRGVPDWVHDEWKHLDRQEMLHLSLVEAIKAYGTGTDAATRKLVKAWGILGVNVNMFMELQHNYTYLNPEGQVCPASDDPCSREGKEDYGAMVDGREDEDGAQVQQAPGLNKYTPLHALHC